MMEADGSGFSFSSADFGRGQDASDPMSWGDIFLDSIVADDSALDSNIGVINDTVLGHNTAQQILQQTSQSSGIGQQLQIQLAQQNVNQQIITDSGANIPTHLQATLTNNGVPQSNNASVGGSVAYLTPSASSQHQHLSSGGNIQNVLAPHQQPAAVTVSQGGTKLVQLGSSFPVAAVQQLSNSVPLQTILQPSQQITGQTIYGGQNPGLFPTQGSVHIENPKVVNVNFGPHVIQPDGSGQQTIIQTAEGKRVLITNSQLQHLPQSLGLTQPIVGTQLIHSAGSSVNNVIRTTMAQAASGIVPSSTASTRQILLPTGQTVIPRQNGNPQAGFSKNVLLRPLNSGVQPVIYQSGQGNVAGQLIQSQPALITSSGTGLQVVNTGASQGNQVQLIAQPSLNQATMGQQQLNQNTLMNLIGNQGVIPNTGNQLPGIVQGQNILVNGQMLNLSQVGGLTLPLQVQGTNTQGAVTVAGINSGNRQFGTTNQQMIIQQPNGQQQIMIQPKNTLSPSIMHPSSGGNQRASSFPPKVARTPTPSANSASSTPAPTPTPSTPTPTPTPDLNLSDFGNTGSKSSQNINILEEALKLSSIDLQSYEDDDFNFFSDAVDPVSSITPPPAPVITFPPKVKPPPPPASKQKSKSSKPKAKPTQPTVNVTVNNNLVGQYAQNQNTQAQKLNINSQQKILTAGGQVYVISSNGPHMVLQQTSTSNAASPGTKPIVGQSSLSSPSTFVTTPARSSINIPVGNLRTVKASVEPGSNRVDPSTGLIKSESASSKLLTSSSQMNSQIILKGGISSIKAQNVTSASEFLPQMSTSVIANEKRVVQIKNQQISTLAGKIVKQEPMPVVKQEPHANVKPAFSFFDSQSQQSSTVCPTTSVVSVSAPHIGSSPSTTLSTNVTLSPHNTIMSTASTQSIPGSQAQASAAPISETVPVKTTATLQDIVSSHSPPLLTSSHSSSSKNSKGKDTTATMKSLTKIKIANTTLKLSLTPQERERLENQISDMTMSQQEQFFSHQQKIIWRTQDLQKKQLEQQRCQQQRLLIQKQKEVQQSKQISASPSGSTAACSNAMDSREKPGTGDKVTPLTAGGLPTTVQELVDKSDKNHMSGGNEKPVPVQHHPPTQNESLISVIQEGSSHPKTVPVQSQASILHTARCLRAEQQLHRDCTLAVSPDTNSPFKNLSDAMRRLVRFHTMQDHKPTVGSESLAEWDEKFEEVSERLMRKKRCFMRRFSKLMLYKDMCPAKWPDNIQNLKSFNENLKVHLDGEKEEALNHPDTFQPLHLDSRKAFADSESEEEYVSEEEEEEEEEDGSHHSVDEVLCDLPRNSSSYRIDHSGGIPADLIKVEVKSEPCAPPSPAPIYAVSSRKRKHEEVQQSSGTLKLVLKRRTTSDNFIVKSSSHGAESVPGDLKPVVDMEICDSLYEFDSKSSVNRDNSVLVRRRDSCVSRQSFSEPEVMSENSSHSSHGQEEEEEGGEEVSESEDDNDAEEGEEEYSRSSSENEESGEEDMEESHEEGDVVEEKIQEEIQQPGDNFFPSFGEEIEAEQSSPVCLDSEARKPDLDAFSESSNLPTEPFNFYQQADRTARTKYSDISSSDPVSAGGSSRLSKKSFSPSDLSFRRHTMSVTSDDVFVSTPGFPQGAEEVDAHSRKEPSPSLHDLIDKEDSFTLEAKFPEFSTSSIRSSIHSSRSATPLHELVATSPASHLETAAANGQLLPSTALFTTPNKNLLQTDYVMFHSSEDDNRDPQSRMINDSLRTAINSVINNEEDEDDVRESSQTRWASTAQRRRPSFFHPSLSSSVSPTPDATPGSSC